MFLKIMKYISGPIIGALIGYFTNLIAVKMLFYPRKEVKVFGHRLPFTPGVIPKGKPRLAHAIGKAVGETLITKEDIRSKILSPDVSEKLTDTVINQMAKPVKESIISITNLPESMYECGKDKIVDKISQDILENIKRINFCKFIEEKGATLIKESISNPMISMFINDDIVHSIAVPLDEKIKAIIDQDGLVYLRPIVYNKINSIDSESVSDLLNKIDISSVMLKGIVSSLINKLINDGLSDLFEQVNIAEIVENKINSMDINELEKLIIQVMKKELNAIVNLGAFIGFILGLINIFF